MNMKELPAGLPGLRLFELKIYRDDRGFFTERYRADTWSTLGQTFVQENHSRSAPGVLRGMHFQRDPAQGKLVSTLRGSIFDVAVDLRRGSPTFGRWWGTELSESNGLVLWIPYGFAHGFCVLGNEPADVYYKVNGYYNPKTEGGLLWNDPAVAVKWPVKDAHLTPRDAAWPKLADVTPLEAPLLIPA